MKRTMSITALLGDGCGKKGTAVQRLWSLNTARTTMSKIETVSEYAMLKGTEQFTSFMTQCSVDVSAVVHVFKSEHHAQNTRPRND